MPKLTTTLTIQEIYDKINSILNPFGTYNHDLIVAVICDIFNLTKAEVEKQLTNSIL